MFKLAILAFSAFAATANAESIGSCAWAMVPIDDRQQFLTGYKESMNGGMAVLSSKDVELRGFVTACSKRDDVPRSWQQAVIASQAIQYGAAADLMSARDIPRAQLDAAWQAAPDAARQCFRANAAKVFGIKDQTCPDPKAPGWFLQSLKMSLQTETPEANQALYYFNAKAQSEWAEALIAKFLTLPPKAH